MKNKWSGRDIGCSVISVSSQIDIHCRVSIKNIDDMLVGHQEVSKITLVTSWRLIRLQKSRFELKFNFLKWMFQKIFLCDFFFNRSWSIRGFPWSGVCPLTSNLKWPPRSVQAGVEKLPPSWTWKPWKPVAKWSVSALFALIYIKLGSGIRWLLKFLTSNYQVEFTSHESSYLIQN